MTDKQNKYVYYFLSLLVIPIVILACIYNQLQKKKNGFNRMNSDVIEEHYIFNRLKTSVHDTNIEMDEFNSESI